MKEAARNQGGLDEWLCTRCLTLPRIEIDLALISLMRRLTFEILVACCSDIPEWMEGQTGRVD